MLVLGDREMEQGQIQFVNAAKVISVRCRSKRSSQWRAAWSSRGRSRMNSFQVSSFRIVLVNLKPETSNLKL